VVSSVLQQVIQTLVMERRNTLTNLRDAIRKNVETISLTIKQGPDPIAADRPELLLQEKKRLEARIETLSKNYTPKHPEISKLMARATVIDRWLKSTKAEQRDGLTEAPVAIMKPLVGGEPSEAEMEVYTDLVQKLNYLNIAFEVEGGDKPSYVGIIEPPYLPYKVLFPKKSLFLLWGIMVGILISAFIVFCLEYLLKSKKAGKRANYMGDLQEDLIESEVEPLSFSRSTMRQ
jgi:hypothetical protein